jgi:hypothetical protein
LYEGNDRPESRINGVAKYERNGTPESRVNDVAILLLKDKVADVQPAKINYEKITAANECLTVGFPGFFSPTHRDECIPLSAVKLGMKTTCYSRAAHQTYYADLLEGRAGYILSKAGKLVKQQHKLYNASPSEGMSGGGLFKNHQLVGLVHAGEKAHTFYVPISSHQNWLQRIIHKINNPTSLNLNEKLNFTACESLLKEKLDPECKIINFTSEKNQITITLLKSELIRCTALLMEHGFAPVCRGELVASRFRSVILLDEPLSSVMQKLAKIPDYKMEDSYLEFGSKRLIS